ncbi:hypothetical protein DSECCO2_428980 [anaerobic digester metagenome]
MSQAVGHAVWIQLQDGSEIGRYIEGSQILAENLGGAVVTGFQKIGYPRHAPSTREDMDIFFSQRIEIVRQGTYQKLRIIVVEGRSGLQIEVSGLGIGQKRIHIQIPLAGVNSSWRGNVAESGVYSASHEADRFLQFHIVRSVLPDQAASEVGMR